MFLDSVAKASAWDSLFKSLKIHKALQLTEVFIHLPAESQVQFCRRKVEDQDNPHGFHFDFPLFLLIVHILGYLFRMNLLLQYTNPISLWNTVYILVVKMKENPVLRLDQKCYANPPLNSYLEALQSFQMGRKVQKIKR